MTGGEIATICATIVGPLAAVAITLWYQQRDRNYDRRLQVFRSLMKWRANWLHPEWVGALNMVPVEFHKNQAVANAFVTLLDKFQDSGFLGTGEEINRAHSNAQTAFVELIQKIAKDLKIDISNFDVRGRVYAPRGWENEQIEIQNIKESILAVLNGLSPLKVEFVAME